MFDLDGRHFKSAFGKDFLDHLLSGVEAGMVQVHNTFVLFVSLIVSTKSD